MKDDMIYLDNSATTKIDATVLQTFIQINEQYFANPASIHEAGVEAHHLLQRARQQLAQMVHTEEKNVVFTSGGTEANNLAVFGIAEANTHIGKHIITTAIEHPSVLQAVKSLEQKGFEVDYLAVDERGVISLDELRLKVRKETILVSIMHINNEMGAIQPILEAACIIHAETRAFFHVDAVQSFGKLPINFDNEDGPDLISISAHKMHGLKNSGALLLRKKSLLTPQILGGGQEYGLRSGTVAVANAVTLAKAARIAHEKMNENMANYQRWFHQLHAFLTNYAPEVHVLSTKDGAPHIVSFAVKNLKGEILINALQKRSIIVSTSSACSSKQTTTSHVVEALNIEPAYKKGVLRISFGAQTTDAHIEQFEQVFRDIMRELKGV